MLDNLGRDLRNAVRKLAGRPVVDEAAVNEFVRELQRALISADVDVKLVKKLSSRIKKSALEKERPKALSTKDHVLKVVYDELVKLVGEGGDIDLKEPKIMLIGLFGSGKTTQAGKLALHLKKRGLSPVLIGTDTWRPAAFQQLKMLGERIDVPAYGEVEAENATEILKDGLEQFKKRKAIIVDTAGRDALDVEMISELKKLERIFQPTEILLVVPADIGQSARKQAEAFSAVNITGVIVTKLDGTAKGGGALTACAEAGVPIKFIGVGEKLEDLERFEPEGFVSRLLGWGDIKALLRRAEEVSKAEEMTPEEMVENFNLEVFAKQMEAAKNMGPMKQVLGMLGVTDVPRELLSQSEEKLEVYRYLIDSMTEKEKKDASMIKGSRARRILEGSGRSKKELKELLKHYQATEKMIKMFKKGRSKKLRSLAKRFKGLDMKGLKGLK